MGAYFLQLFRVFQFFCRLLLGLGAFGFITDMLSGYFDKQHLMFAPLVRSTLGSRNRTNQYTVPDDGNSSERNKSQRFHGRSIFQRDAFVMVQVVDNQRSFLATKGYRPGVFRQLMRAAQRTRVATA